MLSSAGVSMNATAIAMGYHPVGNRYLTLDADLGGFKELQ